MDLDKHIRKVPNYPKKGVLFYDITTALERGEVFRYIINKLVEPFENEGVDKVVGLDARGFIFAAPVAYKLGLGLCIIRKKGKLPHETIGMDYMIEYADRSVEMHVDTIRPGEKVLIVDDLVSTGGTMGAAVKLVEQLEGIVVGISFVIDLPFLGGSAKIKQYKTHCLISYDSEEIKS